MSEYDELDLDLSTARAWSGFQARLADHLIAMTDQESLVLTVAVGEEPEEGSQPYVQFAGFGGGHLRGEVSGNRYLAPAYALDDRQQARLLRDGWEEDDQNWFAQVPVAEADRLAVLAVRALRDVFSVAHPAFLSTPDPGEAESLGLSQPISEPDVSADEPIAVFPKGHDHLVALVDEALTPVFGHPPIKDDDDDIPVRWRSTLVFIRVVEDEPLVELFSFVVREVTDAEAARVEVGILNRDTKFIKFVAAKHYVLAQVELPAYPFVPAQLRSMLHFMSRALDEIDDDLALRTGGRLPLEPHEEAGEEAGEETGAGTSPPSATPAENQVTPRLEQLLAADDDDDEQTVGRLLRELREEGSDAVSTAQDRASAREREHRSSREEALLHGDAETVADRESALRRSRRLGDLLRRGRRAPAGDDRQGRVTGPGQPVDKPALYQEFWSRFAGPATERGWTTAKPPRKHWWQMPAGGGGNHWAASFAQFGCRVELFFGHSDPRVNLHRFELLVRQRDRIQEAFGAEELVFDPLPHAKGCRVEARRYGASVTDQESWDDVLGWMLDRSERLRAAIAAVGGVPTSLPG